VLEAYAKNPLLSFHRLVWDEVKKLKPDISYKQQKNLNFAKLYGAGTIKIAHMLDLITAEEVLTLRQEQAKWDHPKLQGARHAMEIYARVLPEVAQMSKRSTLNAESLGYVTTILGRRARFTDRFYKALNSRIQGSAADLLKLKLIKLHAARKATGFVLRFTVHDEVDGDAPDQTCVEAVHKILDKQAVPLAVPILWNVTTGATWGDCE
jgi:DNA polymerase-1